MPFSSFDPAVKALAEVPWLFERPGMTKPVLAELAAQFLEQGIKEGHQMPAGGAWQPVIMEKLQARLLLCSSQCTQAVLTPWLESCGA